ncbi:MAG: sterol desaturase family protein [Pikeienuella sp.]
MAEEATIRLSVFLGVFALMAMWEAYRPRRVRAQPRSMRWVANLGLVVVDTVVVRLLFPAAAVGAAWDAVAAGWGLFNNLNWPVWLEILLTVVILDFAIWLQHVATHHIPFLWRFHMVHHADRDMDATTGLRFHPVEIIFSMTLKILLVYLLGAAALAIIIFEVLLNAAAMITHANLKVPEKLDRLLRHVVVTPDMHRSHHSVIRSEHDTNFGFFLSVWDRWFGLYTDTPKGGHSGVELGLPPWRDERPARLLWALTAPFRRKT